MAKVTNHTILVVDDDEQIQLLVGQALEKRGFATVGIRNGDEVLKAVREHRPSLIILDILMPGKDGHEVCRALKSDPELSSIPVIMFTIKDEQQDRIAGLELGADDYITKPFFIESLVNKIEHILSS